MTDTAVRPRKKRNRLFWFGMVPFVSLVVIACLTLTGLNRQAQSRLAKAIAEADRDDPNWRLADVVATREKVPYAENSALVVDKVLEHLPADWPSGPRPQPGTAPLPSPESEVLDELTKVPSDQRLHDDLAQSIRRALNDQQEALTIARTLANFPRGGRTIDFSPGFLDTLLPKTQASRSVARLLQMDAALRAHDGDLDGALDSCRALVNCGRSLGDEPTLISQLVRMAIVGVAIRSTERVLSQGEPSDAAMARLQALFADECTVRMTLHGLRGERGGMDEMIRKISTGELPLSALGGDGAAPAGPGVNLAFLGRAMFENQRAIELEWMNDAVRIARKPDFEQPPLWKAFEDRIVAQKKVWHAPLTATLPLLLTPAISAATTAQIRSHAEQGAMVILLASERHRRRTGAWPASVNQVDKALLDAVPVDAFDQGRPLRIEHRDGQFFAYTVGFNHQDDHGAYNIRKAYQGGPYDFGSVVPDVSSRRKAPPLPEFPKDVFQKTRGGYSPYQDP